MKLRTYITRFRNVSKFVLTIFVAPLAITFLADAILLIAKGNTIPHWQIATTLVSCILFLTLLVAGYTDRLDSLIIYINGSLRLNRLKNPKVLILNGMVGGEGYETPPVPAITNFLPDDWVTALKRQTQNWRVEVDSVRSLAKPSSYQLVINPFGEVYPEEEVSKYQTFSQICNYVYSGGVWVNVAGIPFWYCHDSRDPKFANKRITAGYLQKEPSQQGDIVVQRPLFTTVFYQLSYSPGDPAIVDCIQTEEERKRFGDLTNAGGNTKVKMFRAYQPRTPGLIPLLRCANPDMWIIGSLKYGDGYFIVAGLDLRDEGHTSFEKIIASIKGWIDYELKKRTT